MPPDQVDIKCPPDVGDPHRRLAAPVGVLLEQAAVRALEDRVADAGLLSPESEWPSVSTSPAHW
jgi:hypothetical protein